MKITQNKKTGKWLTAEGEDRLGGMKKYRVYVAQENAYSKEVEADSIEGAIREVMKYRTEPQVRSVEEIETGEVIDIEPGEYGTRYI